MKNAGEVVWAVFFIGERDFDSMGFDPSGRNLAKTIAKDSGDRKKCKKPLDVQCRSRVKVYVFNTGKKIMTVLRRISVLGIAVLGMGLPLYANLLTNGSFENGNFVPTAPISDNTMVLLMGATDMTGWTVVSNSLAWIGPSNPFSLSASDGGYFLDLSGYHDNAPYGGVRQTQTIPTVIGQEYQLALDLGTSTIYDTSPVSVLVNAGSASTTFTSTPSVLNGWETFTLNFTATEEDTTISILGEATDNEKYIGLDNVRVVLIPEPGTLALFAGSGLLALVAWRRFRKA